MTKRNRFSGSPSSALDAPVDGAMTGNGTSRTGFSVYERNTSLQNLLATQISSTISRPNRIGSVICGLSQNQNPIT